ncbi:MAG: LysM peptidoglycan-binding domain-containing protein [Bacteroidetes bacterium]|nr:LysM peptidoglycan-binding domain-containing protein [Bacteroidota bacterium]
MNCPVCGHKDIESGAKSCPNCKSDLIAFQHIESVHSKNSGQKRMILVISLISIALIGFLGYIAYGQMKEPAAEEAMESTELTDLQNDNQALQEQVEQLREELEEANSTIELLSGEDGESVEEGEGNGEGESSTDTETTGGSANSHTVVEGETLWSIAVHYFGNGFKNTKIAEDNNLTDPDFVVVGQVLVILN